MWKYYDPINKPFCPMPSVSMQKGGGVIAGFYSITNPPIHHNCCLFYFPDADNNPHHLTLVTYRIPAGFTPVIKSHGNSKVTTPFRPHPTWSSTKKHIKHACAIEGPKSVVASLSAEVGGVLEATAPGQLPRDEKQITNYKARVTLEQRQSCLPGASRDAVADDLFMIMHKCYTEDPLKKFVRAVNAAPEPAVVVTTDCNMLLDFAPLHLIFTRSLWIPRLI